MNRLIAAAAAFAALATAIPATAQMARHHNQERRVEQGVRSGSLTPRETRYIRQQERYIQRMKRYYMRDGHYTQRERASIQIKERQLNQRIYRMKHNYRHR